MTQLALSLEAPMHPVDPAASWSAIGLPSPITSAFAAMDVAEEELAAAWPDHVGEPPGAFVLLARPTVLEHMTLDLYRAHARELIGRMQRDEDTALATRAEVLAGLYGASARAPLRPEALAIYVRLFREALPHLFAQLPEEHRLDVPERWEGQVEEDVRAAQRALRDESRRLTTRARRARKDGA